MTAQPPKRDDDEFRITRWQLKQIAKYADLERIVWAILNKPVPRPHPATDVVESLTLEGAAIVQQARKEAALRPAQQQQEEQR